MQKSTGFHRKNSHPNRRDRRPTLARAIFVFAEQLEQRVLMAANIWNGATADWNTPADWSQDRVPNSTDDVVINSGTVTVSTPDTAGALTTVAGSSLQINSMSLTLNGDVFIGGGLSVSGGTLVNSGETLTLSAAATANLSGGTIQGGTVTGTGGADLVATSLGGTLDGVTLDANLTVDNYATLNVTNGLTLNATMSVGDGAFTTPGLINFQGSQTLSGSGSVMLGGPGGYYQNVLAISDVTGPATLTIGSGITLQGANGALGTYNGVFGSLGSADAMLLNQGDINANIPGGAISINAPGGLNNQGTLEATNNSTLNINAAWSGSSGAVTENNGTFNLGGSFTQANLGAFSRTGGTVNITGTLGGGLALNATTGSWNLSGGTIQGGTVTGTGGADLVATSLGGTLDGVTLDANLTVDNYATLNVTNGLTLNATMSVGDGAFTTPGLINFQGSQTLSGSGSVMLGGPGGYYQNVLAISDVTGPATLTIGSGITLQGANGALGTYNGVFGSLGSADAMLLNQGDINANIPGGAISINAPGGLNNQGTLEATNNSTLNINAAWSGSSGAVTENNGTFNLGGSFTQANLGAFSRTGGTVNITGTLGGGLALNATTGSWNLSGGTIQGGTVTGTGGADLVATSLGGTLDGVTLDANLTVDNYATLNVTNGLTLNATMSVGDGAFTTPGLINFQGSQTLSGSGSVMLGGPGGYYQNVLAISDVTGPATLTIGSGITLQGANGALGTYNGVFGSLGSADAMLLNQGDINANIPGGAISINAPGGLNNQGTLEATNNSTLNINAAWSGSSGAVTENNGTFNLGGSFTQANLGAFSRTGGTVNITGTLGGGLALNATTGSWNLSGGTIQGGTVTGTGGADLVATSLGGTLDGVTLDANLTVDNYATLNVTNGLTLNATMSVGDGAFTTPGLINFQGSQTLSGSGSVMLGGPGGYNQNVLAISDVTGPATLTIGSGITLQGANGALGTYNGTFGAQGSADAMLLNQGDINANIPGGAISINAPGGLNNSGNLIVGSNSALTAANFTQAADSTLINGTMTVNGSFSLTGGTVNVNGQLVINYAISANDPVAPITAALASGRNGGAWNGPGIASSAAAAGGGKFALGYTDSDSGDSADGLEPNQLIVQYSLVGDANLDDSVGIFDLLVVAQNYGKTGKDWAHGNFTYAPNGSVGIADLLLVAQRYGSSLLANSGGLGAGGPTGTVAPISAKANQPTLPAPIPAIDANPLPSVTDDVAVGVWNPISTPAINLFSDTKLQDILD